MVALVDVDGDGDLDLFFEGYDYDVYGGLAWYENTGSATAPAFAPPVINPFGLAVGYANDFFSFGDVDSDGDLDLVTAAYDYVSYYEYLGVLRYHENIGTATAPAFAPPVDDRFGFQPPYLFAPVLADFDVDGDVDILLVVGDTYDYDTYRFVRGGFDYHENVGSPSSPSFARPVRNPPHLSRLHYFTIPALADMDSDGDMDVFASVPGDYNYYSYEYTPGSLHYFRNRTVD